MDNFSTRSAYGKITSVVLLYWMVSISMVFLNKFILSGTFGDQDLTIFAAWYQSLSAVGCVLAVSYGSEKCRMGVKVPRVDPKQLLSKTILMLSMSSVASLTFNNLMLKNIGVAFYQVARSFTIIFTIILSACVLGKGLTVRSVIACLLVVSGFIIAIDQEDVTGTLSIMGVIYGLLASFTAAISGILFKQAEPVIDKDALKLAYYNNLNCMVMFVPLAVGSGQLWAVLESEFIYSLKFWFVLTLTGCLSLAIGWVSALQIKYTSPVAHHLSINAKSVVQTVLAVLFYQEPKTLYWWVGNLLVVTGVLIYALTKVFSDTQVEKLEASAEMELPVKNPKLHANGKADR